MKRMKKMIPVVVVFIMVFLAVPVNTQAQTKKAAVNKTVNTFFANTRKLNCKKMEKCFVPTGITIFDAPVDLYKELRPYSKKLTWKIKSTKITGNIAKVTVRVKYRSLSKAYFNTLLTMVESEVESEGNSKRDPASLMWFKKYMRDTFRESIKEYAPDEITANLRISLQKKGGKWKITQAEDRLLNIVYCDLLFGGKSEKVYYREAEDIIKKFES